MTVVAGSRVDGEAGELDRQPAAFVADVEDGVGEAASVGVGESELPGMDGDVYSAACWCGAFEFATALEVYGRSGGRGGGGSLEDVGAGERGDHHAGGRGE